MCGVWESGEVGIEALCVEAGSEVEVLSKVREGWGFERKGFVGAWRLIGC